ncbi:Neurexophilin [Branchiostoma belcheri]|nr:Neurexophilin [Branchiostoma belcheri]
MASARQYVAFTVLITVVIFLTTGLCGHAQTGGRALRPAPCNSTTTDRLYHQGDVLTVMVVARDREGRPKTYGGDFLRARLVSSDRSPQAISTGNVTDHCNGVYTMQFPLYWAGGVLVSTVKEFVREENSLKLQPAPEEMRSLVDEEKIPEGHVSEETSLDENRRIRVVYSRTHARKFQIYGHFQVCATRTLGVCGPAHGPDMNHSCVRAMYRPAHLVTGADISLVWAPVVRSRPKLFIPRCATSLAEAVTHGPNILCHSTALSRDTAYSPEGCTSVLWSDYHSPMPAAWFPGSWLPAFQRTRHTLTFTIFPINLSLESSLVPYLRRVTCAGPYIPVHTTNYQVSGRVRRNHRPAHAVADISCTHPDTPGHAKFHGTCTGPETEAVKVLQRVREVPNKRIFSCSFVDEKKNATNTTQCFSSADTSLQPHQQCDFSKSDVNGTWICEKPDNIPCSAISRPYLEEELEVDPKEPIHVLKAELPTPQHLPACTWDKSAALGHWSGKVWTSSVCNVRVFTQNDIRRCLANRTVYMQGDSTIRQWGLRLLTVVPLNHNKTKGYIARLEGDNSQWNISVRYRFHHFPVQGSVWCVFYDFRYVVETLDTYPGGPNTVIVLSLWAHFTAEPLELIRSRLSAIRAAIHRLKRRAPGTRVFVRTGTTREHKGGKLEFYLLASDWLAYQITEVIREMFRADPDVVVLDTWDMSVCQPGKDNVHPDQTMVDSYVCYVFSENVGKEWRLRTSLARHSPGCTKCKSVVCTPSLAVSGCVHRGRTHTYVFRTARTGHALRSYSHVRVVNPQTARFRTAVVLTTHGCPTLAHVFERRQHAEARTARKAAVPLRNKLGAAAPNSFSIRKGWRRNSEPLPLPWEDALNWRETSPTCGDKPASKAVDRERRSTPKTMAHQQIVQPGAVLPNTAIGATPSSVQEILCSEVAPSSQNTNLKPHEVRLPLGDNVFLTVAMFRNKPIINVREFYHPDPADVNKMRPGKKGLALTPKQWAKLKALPLLGAILDATCHTIPYYFGRIEPKMHDLGYE